ncbi:MAG: hypothetical protein M3O36_01160 [Myxococcota bacterium]|nr:hypothetical protein [Myxococcota bacterium]
MPEQRLLARTQTFLVRALAGLALFGLAVMSLGGFFASRDAGAASPTTRPTSRPPPSKKATIADAGAVGVPLSAGGMPLRTGSSSALGAGALSDAGVLEAKTLEGGTRSFKFSELDIEGRLKSPQLVYFLRRVRAEFAAEDLGHRSFLREMSETRRESSF